MNRNLNKDPNDLTGLGQLRALLGPGTVFEGKLCFEDKVRVEGRITGEVHSEGTLIVAGDAEIIGNIHVGTLIMRSGRIQGDVVARDLVEAHAPASISGDIHAPSVLIEKGVIFDGKCTMSACQQGVPDPLPDR